MLHPSSSHVSTIDADTNGIARFRPRFLEKRKQGLTYFLKLVVIIHASDISTDLFLAVFCSTLSLQDHQF